MYWHVFVSHITVLAYKKTPEWGVSDSGTGCSSLGVDGLRELHARVVQLRSLREVEATVAVGVGGGAQLLACGVLAE